MEKRIQAIYKDGALHPLEPLALDELQQVSIAIETPENGFASDSELAAFFSPEEWEAAATDPITHEDVHRALSTMQGTLSEAVIAQREDR